MLHPDTDTLTYRRRPAMEGRTLRHLSDDCRPPLACVKTACASKEARPALARHRGEMTCTDCATTFVWADSFGDLPSVADYTEDLFDSLGL